LNIRWKQALPGDVVVFKRNGALSAVLSFLLGLTDSEWRHRKWQGWHVGVVIKPFWETEKIRIFEAEGKGTKCTDYPFKSFRADDVHVYRWLDDEPSIAALLNVVKERNNWKYDYNNCFSTAFFYLWWKLTGKEHRVFDRELMCWETLDSVMRLLGKPIFDMYEVIMINRIMKRLERE